VERHICVELIVRVDDDEALGEIRVVRQLRGDATASTRAPVSS